MKKVWFFWHSSPILFLFWIVFVVQSLSHARLFVTHGWQYARLPCPSVSGGCSNSCALSWWWYPLSPSSLPVLNPFQHLGLFLMSPFFASGGQNIGIWVSASIFLMNIQGWFPLGWTGWISLQSKGLSRVFSNTTVQKHQFFSTQPSLWSNPHIHTWLLEKPCLRLYGLLSAKWCFCFLIHCLDLS